MDSFPNDALDRVTALAARLFDAPISVVSVVDDGRTWLKSHYGAELEQILREIDLSASATVYDQPIIIEDATADDRVRENPLVTGPLSLRFYAGVPLRALDGQTVGTLAVLDTRPHSVSETDVANLEDLAALVMGQLDLRRESRRITGELQNPTQPGAIRTTGEHAAAVD
jgi:GAF domain-containing protein